MTSLIIVCGVFLPLLTTGSCRSVNLLLNPSFEATHAVGTPPLYAETSASWTTTARRSMWNTDRSLATPVICEGEVGGRTGSCSLFLGESINGGDNTVPMVFVSQFIGCSPQSKAPDGIVDGPLLIEFWTYFKRKTGDVDQSSSVSMFHLRVDISYTDVGRYLTVRMTPRTSDINHASSDTQDDRKSWIEYDKFVRTCVVVPHYGRVRSLMAHLVVDYSEREQAPLKPPIYVDDVSISCIRSAAEVGESLNGGCELYVESFPRDRHVLADFLSPVGFNSHSIDGTVSVTLATQLTLDRLPALERIASSWQGDVSAALLLYNDDETSQYSVLRDVTEIYYRSPSLRKHVTLHIVREDSANRKRNRQQRHSFSNDPSDNDDDRKRYPVNFLRNVAIAHARTSHVFYVDADLIVPFPESEARRWVTAAADDDVDKTAFLVPVFGYASSKTLADIDVTALPRSKAELLDRLKVNADGLEPLSFSSHAVVRYRRWYSADKPYHVDYQENMEPYFIVRSTAPVMSDLYAGYGRDKCAYSRDLASAGFQFSVLPEAFLVYVADPPSVPTIFQRSDGVQPEMFFSIEFHRHDIEAGYFRSPFQYNFRRNREQTRPLPASTSMERTDEESVDDDPSGSDFYQHRPGSCRTNTCKDITDMKQSSMYTSDAIDPDESDHVGDNDDDCRSKTVEVHPTPAEMLQLRPGMLLDRIDQAVELLMMTYGVVTYVELSSTSTIHHHLNLMLPLMQPEVVVTVQLGQTDDDEATSDGHVIDGVFETYRPMSSLNENLTNVLDQVASDHPGPKLYAVTTSQFTVQQLVGYVEVLLGYATDDDVIAVFDLPTDKSSKSAAAAAVLRGVSCSAAINHRWRLHHLSERHWMVKSVATVRSQPHIVPPFPVCSGRTEQSTRKMDKVDIVLFSKNRPLQTFAFLDSLSKMVSGVGTVWIIVKSDNQLIDEGYQLAKRCFNERSNEDVTASMTSSTRTSFRVEFIPDDEPLRDVRGTVIQRNVAQTLGKTLIDILRMRSKADHVMLAVDEMIWLRPVNLSRAAQQLKHCDSGKDSEELFSVQLRLGENIGIYANLPDRDLRFKAINIAGDDTEVTDDIADRMYAFYPRRWPYDFGYVLNVDGTVARRRDLLADFEGKHSGRIGDCRTPGCVEDKWIRWSLRRRSRQWQVLYSRRSTVVNNVLPEDGRVSGSEQGKPREGSVRLAERLVLERKKIDVDSFVDKYADKVRETHVRLPVEYTDVDNDCR